MYAPQGGMRGARTTAAAEAAKGAAKEAGAAVPDEPAPAGEPAGATANKAQGKPQAPKGKQAVVAKAASKPKKGVIDSSDEEEEESEEESEEEGDEEGEAVEAVVVPPSINLSSRAGLKMEIQACDPVDCDSPCGECDWEVCIVESDNGRTCDVRIEADGELCTGIACRYLRMLGGRESRKRKA